MRRRGRPFQVQAEVNVSHARRETLVDEMLDWEQDDIDLEGYLL